MSRVGSAGGVYEMVLLVEEAKRMNDSLLMSRRRQAQGRLLEGDRMCCLQA
jgi:hypothetical protein